MKGKVSKRMCEEFLRNPTVNPLTGRKIVRGGEKYEELLKSCGKHVKFRRIDSKVHLYGSPIFSFFYHLKKDNSWVGKEITDFRPDPSNYLKANRIYRATLNTFSIEDSATLVYSITVYKRKKEYEFLVLN